MYVRIAHLADGDPDFSPPFDDPLIDEAFLEFSELPAVSFSDRRSPRPQNLTVTGVFERITVRLQTSVHCAEGWNGTACEIFCTDTSCSQGIV